MTIRRIEGTKIQFGGTVFDEKDIEARLKTAPMDTAAVAGVANTAASSVLQAALPSMTQNAAAAGAQAGTDAATTLINAQPKSKGGLYAIQAADVAAGLAAIATGMPAITSAQVQIYDANNILLSGQPKVTWSGGTLKVAANGIAWQPVAGQKISWFVTGL